MSQPVSERQFYAETYDVSVPDWPGEIDFYHQMVDQEVKANKGTVLEVACGTGRVAIRLAQNGVNVVGLDRSPEMLEIARQKSTDLPNMRWVESDMRSFELNETFGLVIIPGHAFQNLITPEDQAACLECIKQHLNPGGALVVHLDHMNDHNVRWLGDLCGEKGGGRSSRAIPASEDRTSGSHFAGVVLRSRHPNGNCPDGLGGNGGGWTGYEPLGDRTDSITLCLSVRDGTPAEAGWV